MSAADAAAPAARSGGSQSELTRYGITRVPADNFEFGGYHYSNLDDAVAEAKRRQARDGPG